MKKIDSLTGLRFFAAAAIVLQHSQTVFFPLGTFEPFNLIGAVPLFFVLSGFVLALNVDRYRSWPAFIVARIARIWPAHVAAIVFLFAIMYPYSPSLVASADGIVKLVVNILMLQAWSPDPAVYFSYNAPSWSISCELFFYLSFPLCVLVFARRALIRLLLLCMAMSAFVCTVAWFDPGIDAGWLSYINPVVNLPIFAIGVAAGLAMKHLAPRSSVGVGWATLVQLVALAVALAGNVVFIKRFIAVEAYYPFTLGAAPCYAVLLIALTRYNGAVSYGLSLAPMVYLGEISYSVYLFHQLIIRWYSTYHTEFFDPAPIWLQCIGVWAATIGISAFVHAAIERPARKWIPIAWAKFWMRRPVATVDAFSVPKSTHFAVTRSRQGSAPLADSETADGRRIR